jgi:hypothetical protein
VANQELNFESLMATMAGLDRLGVYYEIRRYREHSIMLVVSVPGERWEIEFFDDGTEAEVGRLRSDGHLMGSEAITELCQRWGNAGE